MRPFQSAQNIRNSRGPRSADEGDDVFKGSRGGVVGSNVVGRMFDKTSGTTGCVHTYVSTKWIAGINFGGGGTDIIIADQRRIIDEVD